MEKDIRLFSFPLCKAGWPFIVIPLALALGFAALGPFWIALVLVALSLFFAWFFRDPERKIPAVADCVIAPADGRVVRMETVSETEHLGRRVKAVSIFMNLLDVHVNRAPVAGRVAKLARVSGEFIAADRQEASSRNCRHLMFLDLGRGKEALVVQVAGLVARRIICFVEEGDCLQRGQRFGMILFGSRVDLYLPLEFKEQVRVGQKVKAGSTIIGVLSHEAA